jgi:hypothetical protein
VADEAPFLQVVRGDATAEEIAALVAALTAVAARSSGVDESEPGPVRNEWNDKARLMRSPVHPSPAGWRRSALPS